MGVISGTTAAIIGMTAMAAGGAGYMMAQGGKQKTPEMPKMPESPTPESAEEKAKAELIKKRRIQQRTGGKTILADRYGAATETKTLLGE